MMSTDSGGGSGSGSGDGKSSDEPNQRSRRPHARRSASSSSRLSRRQGSHDSLDASFSKSAVVPSERKGYKAKKVFVYGGPEGPKPDPETVKHVVINDECVTTIPGDCFADCMKLKTVKISSPLTSIGERAFRNCSSLKSVELPSSLCTIGKYAFEGCTNESFTSISIPESVTHIGEGAFASCNQLKSIDFMTVEFGTPSNLTSIEARVFDGCESLKAVTVPDGVVNIKEAAFSTCGIEEVSVPSSVTTIERRAFFQCKKLKIVTVHSSSDPPALISIGGSTFEDCTLLESIELPSSVKSIGESAFARCVTLKSIKIPSCVTICSCAFEQCTSLEDVELMSGSGSSLSVTTEVGASAFEGCSKLKCMKLPFSTITIGDSAFQGCSQLQSIELPTALSTIGPSAFEECTSLEGVEIPFSVAKIGKRAFFGCSNYGFNSIKIPPHVGTLEESVFESCSRLSVISIPKGITRIEARACKDCTWLDSLFHYSSPYPDDDGSDVPARLKEIGEEAFYNCEFLEGILVAKRASAIGKDAFVNCEHYLENTIKDACNLYTNGELKREVFIQLMNSGIYTRNISWLKEIHTDDLLKLLEESPVLNKNLNRQMSSRAVVFFLFLELYMNTLLCVDYVWAVIIFVLERGRKNSLLTLYLIFGYFLAREIIQLYLHGLKYFRDTWNLIDVARLGLLISSFNIMENPWKTSTDAMIPNETRHVLWTTGAVLLLSLTTSLRTAFLPFSRFVGGLVNIFRVLIPFLVVSTILLLIFALAYFVLGFDDKNCQDQGFCTLDLSMLTVVHYFLSGVEFKSKWWLDVAFGLIVVVILLNVVIAIVSKGWDETDDRGRVLFWKYRVDFLSSLEDLFQVIRSSTQLVSAFLRSNESVDSWLDTTESAIRERVDYLDRLGDRTVFDNVNWPLQTPLGIRSNYNLYMKRPDLRSFERDWYWLRVRENADDVDSIEYKYVEDAEGGNINNSEDDLDESFYNVPQSRAHLACDFLLCLLLLPLGLFTLGVFWPNRVRQGLFDFSAVNTQEPDYDAIWMERDRREKEHRSRKQKKEKKKEDMKGKIEVNEVGVPNDQSSTMMGKTKNASYSPSDQFRHIV